MASDEPIAILSDIHGNLEALEVVLADVERQKIRRILCLGDVIGYGPDPVACLRHALRFELVLMGNHEEAAVHGPFVMGPIARGAIIWTRATIEAESDGEELLRYLADLPLMFGEDGRMLVHGSPRDPTIEYILRTDCDELFGEVTEKIQSIFSLFDRLCFVGHTHAPGVIDPTGKFLTPADFGGRYRFGDGHYICNVGSVGQPRDGNSKACYTVLEGDCLSYHRLEYDVNKTAAKIKAISEIHDRCAERLFTGS